MAGAGRREETVAITALLERWWREASAAGRKPSTHESYRNTIKAFSSFLGHDDANRVGAEDVIAFKDHRLQTRSTKTGRAPSAKTVKDSDLSALKTIFGWAVGNQLMPLNPAAGVTIKLGKSANVRSKNRANHFEKLSLAYPVLAIVMFGNSLPLLLDNLLF